MRKLLTVTLLSGLLTVLRMASGFVIAKVVAVYTGPSGIAILGQMQSLVAALNGLSSNQISQGVVRFTAENADNGLSACSEWWKAATTLVSYILLIIAIIVIGFSVYISEWLFNSSDYTWVVILATLALPLNSLNIFINAVLNGRQEYKKYFIVGAISTLSGLVIITLATIEFGINGAIASAAVNNAVAGCFAYLLIKKNNWAKKNLWFGKPNIKNIVGIRGYFLMGIVGALTGPTSLILVRKIIIENGSITDAGNWQAVWKISEAYLSIITLALSTYYFPQLVKIVKRNEILREAKQTALFVIPIVTLFALIIYLLRNIIIIILFSYEFNEANKLFGIQLIGDILRVTSYIPASILMARGYISINIKLEIIFCSSLVLLCYIFVPIFGTQGANIGYAINYAMYLIVTTIIFFKIINKTERNT
ncbi:MAG: O-antigen translocase [Glaciimonas sp.]|nr:O-antigen translocase [Glaciimonas sp.]